MIIMEMQQTHFRFITDIIFQLWTETMTRLLLAALVPHRMAEDGGFTGKV